MVQMQANQHLLLQPWILAKRIGSILISGNILSTTQASRVIMMAGATQAAAPGRPGLTQRRPEPERGDSEWPGPKLELECMIMIIIIITDASADSDPGPPVLAASPNRDHGCYPGPVSKRGRRTASLRACSYGHGPEETRTRSCGPGPETRNRRSRRFFVISGKRKAI